LPFVSGIDIESLFDPPVSPEHRIKTWSKSKGRSALLLLIGVFGLTAISFGILQTLWHWETVSSFLLANPIVTLVALAWLALILWRLAIGRMTDSKPEERDIMVIVLILGFAAFAGIFLVAALQSLATPATRDSAARVATLWGGAYCAVGFLGGFLFGIPKTLQRDDGPDTGDPYKQRVNTNLEQISDWLTKIIVGLGLVQLRKVPEYLGRASEWMAQSFTAAPGVQTTQIASVSTSVILLYSIVGFLAGYLITRLYLSGAFRRADQAGPDSSVRAAGGKSNVGLSKDDTTRLLRAYWKSEGDKINAEHERAILDWMQKNGLIGPNKQVLLPNFINLPNYAAEREKAVKDLNIS
jgi:hypothetical protein